MKVSELKDLLKEIKAVNFRLADGSLIPQHFHVTEIGKVSKHFIDCGGTERTEEKVSFQLWTSNDYDHRLAAEKLNKIVEIATSRLQLPDAEIEVEYQGDTIGKYALNFKENCFVLENLYTNCLAKDNCGVPQQETKQELNQVANSAECCTSGSGCC